MTDSDWLKAKDPDAMLRLVGHRFSPRQWQLLACGVVRRIWDLLPEHLRDTADWFERHAGGGPGGSADGIFSAVVKARLDGDREREVRAGIAAAREVERQIVLAADPDADPEAYRGAEARKTNPAAPLFRAACRNAGAAVRLAGEAVEHAARAVALLAVRPGPDQLNRVREAVIEALRVRADANLHRNTALKLKEEGDKAADRENGRNVGHRFAAALDMVDREERMTGYRHADLYTEKQAADRKALGRLLHELAGNPFRGFPFDPRWRTSTVVGLARAIDADRAFDRMPFLADALLDADCDDEAVLRHCRGTEAHAPDPAHARGCWVLDLILEREPAFFTPDPAPLRHKAPRSRRVLPPLFDVAHRGESGGPG